MATKFHIHHENNLCKIDETKMQLKSQRKNHVYVSHDQDKLHFSTKEKTARRE